MSQAIGMIVDAYVKLGRREELEHLKAHRCRLATELKSIDIFDLRSMIAEIEQEIEVIEAGLAEINRPVWTRALAIGFSILEENPRPH